MFKTLTSLLRSLSAQPKPIRKEKCWEIGDNLHVCVRAREKENLARALQIAFSFSGSGQAKSYYCDWKYGFVLRWYEGGEEWVGPPEERLKIKPIRHKFNHQTATEFIWDWLQKINYENFEYHDWSEECQDHGDVYCEKGFEVYVEDWGHVNDSSYVICAVRPAYIWIGK